MMFSRETGKQGKGYSWSLTLGHKSTDKAQSQHICVTVYVCKRFGLGFEFGFGFGFMFGFSDMHRKRDGDSQRKQITITRKCY